MRGVFDANPLHIPSAALRAGGDQAGDGLVAVVGQDDLAADGQQVEHRRRSPHARGEGHGLAALQAAQQLLERFPRGRGVISAVGTVGAELEVRRRHRGTFSGAPAPAAPRPATTAQVSGFTSERCTMAASMSGTTPPSRPT